MRAVIGVFLAIFGSVFFVGCSQNQAQNLTLTTPKGYSAPIKIGAGTWEDQLKDKLALGDKAEPAPAPTEASKWSVPFANPDSHATLAAMFHPARGSWLRVPFLTQKRDERSSVGHPVLKVAKLQRAHRYRRISSVRLARHLAKAKRKVMVAGR